MKANAATVLKTRSDNIEATINDYKLKIRATRNKHVKTYYKHQLVAVYVKRTEINKQIKFSLV